MAREKFDGHLNPRLGKLELQVEATYGGEIEIRDRHMGGSVAVFRFNAE